MQFPFNYTSETKLKSFSDRLGLYSERRTNPGLFRKAKQEYLKHNLPWVIAHIILKLKFAEIGKSAFETVVAGYNNAHNTNLSFDDFFSIFWVREVHDEIIIPASIQSYLIRIILNEKDNKAPEIVPGKEHITKCLLLYYKRYFDNAKLTITISELETVLSEHASPGLTVAYFDNHELLRLDKINNVYNWTGYHEEHFLTNEIAAVLWTLCAGKDATPVQFKKWFKLLRGTGIWVDDLTPFLCNDDTQKIASLAYEMICSEKDLIKSEDEFAKSWLDAEQYRYHKILEEIPVLEFNDTDTFSYIESVRYHQKRFQDSLYYQQTRSYVWVLLRLIVYQNKQESVPYADIRELLLDISRPFIVWTTFLEMHKQFPQTIPYLLTDSGLAPLVFLQIDKIEISESAITRHADNEKRFEEDCVIKNGWWLEMFEFLFEQMNQPGVNYEECGEMIARIMLQTADDTFHSGNGIYQHVLHETKNKRYRAALKILFNKRSSHQAYPQTLLNTSFFTRLFPGIVTYLEKWYAERARPYSEMISIASGFLDLAVEMLNHYSSLKSQIHQFGGLSGSMYGCEDRLVKLLYDYIFHFYAAKEIETENWGKQSVEKRKIKRMANDFGFEVIDWGTLYLNFHKMNLLKSLTDAFESSIVINTSLSKYDDTNREESAKIKIFLKSLMLGYLHISRQQQVFISKAYQVENFLKYGEKLITEISDKYSFVPVSDGHIDIFDETLSPFGYHQYHQHLDELLFKCINYFKQTNTPFFIDRFFKNSINLDKMLTAVNEIENKTVTEQLSKRINGTNIEDFIKSRFTVTDLQHALINAVNSKNHWQLALPLIKKIKKHYEKIKHSEQYIQNLLFEIDLLIAFKEKNYQKLINAALPKRPGRVFGEIDNWAEHTRQLFIALHKLYNEDDFAEAIKLFGMLVSSDNKNTRFSFYLYRARLLKAVKTDGFDDVAISQAWNQWQEFVNNHSKENGKGIIELSEQIDCCNLYYYASVDDSLNFDTTINRLLNKLVYDDEIVLLSYNYYIRRGMYDYAYDFLLRAEEYINEMRETSSIIEKLIEDSQSPQLIRQLQKNISRISSLAPEKLVLVLPENINGKRNVSTFILQELVSGLTVVKDKIQSIKQVTHEDRYTDLLLATLRLRFAIFGWTITGQERTGNSATGINAGEPDILVQASGKTFVIGEALNLKGKDFTKTSEHLLKCFNYADYLSEYFIIIYYNGSKGGFDKTWENYGVDVLSTPYPTEFAINAVSGFENIDNSFNVKTSFKIGRTQLGKDITMFHIMVDLSR